ncbi:MAG: dienelactone hydrolase family protein [Pseudomonadota bacterium]
MLSTFSEFEFSLNEINHRVLKKGDGAQPAVLIIQELPGVTKETLALADRLHQDGFTIYLPLLLGEPNCNYEPLKNLVRLCISKEFRFLNQRQSSPITHYLRALCRHMQTECDGEPVGAIGMCFSGGFVLSLMIDESVAAPVMTQPAPIIHSLIDSLQNLLLVFLKKNLSPRNNVLNVTIFYS